VLASTDGTTLLRIQQQGHDSVTLGEAVAEELLADGGRALLATNGASP